MTTGVITLKKSSIIVAQRCYGNGQKVAEGHAETTRVTETFFLTDVAKHPGNNNNKRTTKQFFLPMTENRHPQAFQ